MESDFKEHTQCEKCGSSDANAVYSDGHTYCFSCETHSISQSDDCSPKTLIEKKPKSDSIFVGGDYRDLIKRKISSKTCKTLGYRVGEYEGKTCHVVDIKDDQGITVAQKIRLPNKDFRVIGDLKKGGLVFQDKFKPGGKRLVITEGEIDALSYYEVQPKWEVVSVPNGASGAVKAIKRSLEYVDSFSEVVFLFDQDTTGYESAKKCAELLTPGTSKIAFLPLKDANEMLIAGRIVELKEAIYQARPFSPEGIIRGEDLSIEQLQQSTPRGKCIPFVALNTAIRGIRKRELIMICAGSGIGKSTLAREISYHLSKEHKQKIGYVMLEESVNKTAQALIAIDNDIPLGDLMENPELITPKQWEKSFKTIIPNTAFYDSFGSSEVDTLISKIRYLAVGLECDYIILDHVSMVVSGLDTDERKTLDILMTKLRQLVENTGVGIIAVSHLKRGDKRVSFNDGGKISLTDLRGSAAIEQLSDIVIAAERDQQSETSNVTQLRLLKNRPFGIVGACGFAQFIETTGRLIPLDDFSEDEKITNIQEI